MLIEKFRYSSPIRHRRTSRRRPSNFLLPQQILEIRGGQGIANNGDRMKGKTISTIANEKGAYDQHTKECHQRLKRTALNGSSRRLIAPSRKICGISGIVRRAVRSSQSMVNRGTRVVMTPTGESKTCSAHFS